MIGKYKLRRETRIEVGLTTFFSPKGTKFDVRSFDKPNSKVLIDFGDGYIDWFHTRWLDRKAKAV